MISKINHIGIAVKSLEEQIPFYRDILNLKFEGTEEVPDQKVKVAMFQVGEVRIELLEPTSEKSPIARFIDKKGQGMHHIAYESNDIEKEIEQAAGKGIKMIDKEPRDGAHNTKIAFMHPRSTGKVLTEICQSNK
ncbi:MAG: methylmalonyl-CoA epimerase [Candidatus Marinimicrobia bacterium]|nr:methylmalonyl-CoA epimerase [Candidatus Neomarinimicrobiota bacterium]